jgi:hypothetical protein
MDWRRQVRMDWRRTRKGCIEGDRVKDWLEEAE